MIKLTRLRQNTPFILNPDHIERVDTHVDTVVRLTTGAEYVVNETGEDIVRMTIEYRARVIALAGGFATSEPDPEPAPAPAAHAEPPAVTDPVDQVDPAEPTDEPAADSEEVAS